MSSKSLSWGINNFLHSWQLEDLGAVLVISSLYRIVASNLIVNVFYILSGVLASLYIFRIGRKLMSQKYAFMGALAYSISSFVLWFHASGLKESIMVFLIILFFDQYYEFTSRKKPINFILSILALILLLLFRPAITFGLLGSVFLTLLFLKNRSNVQIFISFFLLLFFLYFFDYVEIIIANYFGTSIGSMLESKVQSGMVKGSLQFTYAVNLLSGLIGPLPTVVPGYKVLLSFYSPGLIFRVFFSLIFWFGFYYAYKRKFYIIFPLIFFVLLESSSLTFILEGVELRKSLPHFFAIFLVSFWFLDFFRKENSLSPQTKRNINRLVNVSVIIFSLLIYYWNFRWT